MDKQELLPDSMQTAPHSTARGLRFGAAVATGILPTAVLIACISLAVSAGPASAENAWHTVGDVRVRTEPIFSESFRDMGSWKNLAPETTWKMDEGVLKGSWAPGGSALWLDRELEGNILILADARVLPPEPRVAKPNRPGGSKNINIRFHVRGPDDTDILGIYPELLRAGTGPNGIGDDQYWGYFVTWTAVHSRIRRSPGYVNVSENRDYLPVLNETHRIQLLFLDGRILYSVDGRLLHDYTDPAPYQRGKIALLTSNSNIEFSRFEVYEARKVAP